MYYLRVHVLGGQLCCVMVESVSSDTGFTVEFGLNITITNIQWNLYRPL